MNITDGSANVIGGGGSARNVISGNLQSGVAISGATATGNQVLGNLIGTNGSGMSGIANGNHGVVINNAPGNIIGAVEAGNVISGNAQNGVFVFGPARPARDRRQLDWVELPGDRRDRQRRRTASGSRVPRRR